MEVLSFILFLIIVFIVISIKNSINKKLDGLINEIRDLKSNISNTSIEIIPKDKTLDIIKAQPPTESPKTQWQSSFTIVEEPPANKINKLEEIEDMLALEKQKQVLQKENIDQIKIEEPLTSDFTQPKSFNKPKPGFFDRHPDLEKFIGENLVNKIGIAILVLAIAFFVKYAIDQDWIGPVGRVGIGILCGAILLVFAHRLRTNYIAFSSVLVGGGLAVFYFTMTLAYHQFHLLSQPASFISIVIITIFAIVLSLLYNRQELAVIALVGGFATPFLVSNGSGDYQTLFTYLLILNIGLLVIAYNKGWRLLNMLAFLFTVIIFGTWLATLSNNTIVSTYQNAFLFATSFYLLFFIINIANNLKEKKHFIAPDFGILLLNTALYFAVGIYILTVTTADHYRGLFTAAMAIFNLLAAFLLFKNQKVDRNILYLLIGLTLTFISLTAPIQLHGNYITLFWASETVLLYWLYQRTNINLIKTSSFIIWIAMLVSLVLNYFNTYNSIYINLPIILNQGFITGIYCALASYLLYLFIKNNALNNNVFSVDANLFSYTALIILFVTGFLEIYHQFQHFYSATNIHIQYLLLYIYAFILIFIIVAKKVQNLKVVSPVLIILLSLSLFIYLFSIQENFSLLRTLLTEKKYSGHFIAHWIGAGLCGISFFVLLKILRTNYCNEKNIAVISWVLCSWMVIFLSSETHLLSNNIYYNGINNWNRINSVFIKTGFPILWGVCSFAFMWLGMHYKFRTLRIISLSLFLLTLLKLFLFDIKNIPIGGKITAFFCLGILLLIVSFMYQRLKKILIEDEKNKV